jgi:hypothetical protein
MNCQSKEAGFGKREVFDLGPSLINAGAFEDDHHVGNIGASVILANDAGFPQPPDIGDFSLQVGSERIERDPGLERIVSNDLQENLLMELIRKISGMRKSAHFR